MRLIQSPSRPLAHALGLGLALSITAGAARADKIDDVVAVQMQRQHIPAAAVAVIKAGKPVKIRAYGTANLELQAPADPASVFKIGSVSKQFIASGIMLLNAEGKVGLDDPVTKYFPDAPPKWQAITVSRLMSHTSGLQREAPGFDPLKVQADIDVVRTAYALPLSYETGKGWEYSNLGYFMLADIIRQASQQPWDQYIAERLFKPAGMTATRTTTTRDLVPARTDGYEWTGGGYRNAEEYLALRPSGAFISTLQDLVKWDAALRANTVLSAEQQKLMQAPATLLDGSTKPYGLGWEIDTVSGHREVHHGGSLPGFRAEMARFVDDDLTVIVLTNSGAATPARIALGVADQIIPDLLPNRATISVPATVLDTYAGRYQMTQGRVMHVTRVDGVLQVSVQTGARTVDRGPLRPEAEGRFFLDEDSRVTYLFSVGPSGQRQVRTQNETGRLSEPSLKLD